MIFIKVTKDEIDAVMQIIEEARLRLFLSGSTQWNTGDGYPTKEDMLNDIEKGYLYAAVDNDTIIGVAALIPEENPDYIKIDGSWQIESHSYMTIHRVAIANNVLGKGTGLFIMNQAKEITKKLKLDSIRIDTHRLNNKMLSLLNKAGFKHCGKIYLSHTQIDNERESFEYVIKF